jgi:hypothetical protein
MKKLLFATFILLNSISTHSWAQNTEVILYTDYWLKPIKLESKLEEIKSAVNLHGYKCTDCNKIDSTKNPYFSNYLRLIFGETPVNVYGSLFFIDDSLYKLSLDLHTSGYNHYNIKDHLLSKYGKETNLIVTERGTKMIWEFNSSCLSINVPRYNGEFLTIENMTITSNRLIKKYNERLSEYKKANSNEYDLFDYKIRRGAGNGAFIPDINTSAKLLLANTTISNFEKILPSFSNTRQDTTYNYNSATNKYDLFNSIMYSYILDYKNGKQLLVKVDVRKNKVIKRIEYEFYNDSGINFKLQRTQNGFIINEKMSKVLSNMGFNECRAYDNSQKIHLIEYTSKHFIVEKY